MPPKRKKITSSTPTPPSRKMVRTPLEKLDGLVAQPGRAAEDSDPVPDRTVNAGSGSPTSRGPTKLMALFGTEKGQPLPLVERQRRDQVAPVMNAARSRLGAEEGDGDRPAPAVQGEDSARMLTRLAVPRVGKGPSIDIQKELIAGLEKVFKDKYEDSESPPDTIDLGGFFIHEIPTLKKTKSKARQQAQYDNQLKLFPLDIKGGALRTPIADSLAEKAIGEGLGPRVVENTFRTMIDAEQVAYLQKAGLPNRDWTILVNVHYIRARPKDMAGFHKDTTGQTLFANLNYHVEDPTIKDETQRGMAVRGPEYVLNPPISEVHEELISGTYRDRRGDTAGLPEQFMSDLQITRKVLGEPEEIKSSGTVQPYGYVAFVDEAIHHATPWFGHRYVTADELAAYLERNVSADVGKIRRATRGRNTWAKLLKMIDDSTPETKYTSLDFAKTMSEDEFDFAKMFQDVGAHARQTIEGRAHGAAGGFYAASINNPISGDPVRPPITKKDRALRREASQENLSDKQLPLHVDRRFLRTWVRAVRRVDIDKSAADFLKEQAVSTSNDASISNAT